MTTNWLTIATTVFDVAWLIAALTLLWLIWRTTSRHIHHMERVLMDVALTDAESTRKAVDALTSLVDEVRAHKGQKEG